MINDNQLRQRFHQIIEEHKGILFKVAKTYCQNEEDRQDLIQEIMIQIWQSLSKYNERFAITTWLYRIALNVAISFHRKSTTRAHLNIPFLGEHTSIKEEASNERQEQFVLLEKFISELHHLDKALLLLYLEDKSHAEISEIMGLTVTNVGTKLGRIKQKLKSKFSPFNS